MNVCPVFFPGGGGMCENVQNVVLRTRFKHSPGGLCVKFPLFFPSNWVGSSSHVHHQHHNPAPNLPHRGFAAVWQVWMPACGAGGVRSTRIVVAPLFPKPRLRRGLGKSGAPPLRVSLHRQLKKGRMQPLSSPGGGTNINVSSPWGETATVVSSPVGSMLDEWKRSKRSPAYTIQAFPVFPPRWEDEYQRFHVFPFLLPAGGQCQRFSSPPRGRDEYQRFFPRGDTQPYYPPQWEGQTKTLPPRWEDEYQRFSSPWGSTQTVLFLPPGR